MHVAGGDRRILEAHCLARQKGKCRASSRKDKLRQRGSWWVAMLQLLQATELGGFCHVHCDFAVGRIQERHRESFYAMKSVAEARHLAAKSLQRSLDRPLNEVVIIKPGVC